MSQTWPTCQLRLSNITMFHCRQYSLEQVRLKQNRLSPHIYFSSSKWVSTERSWAFSRVRFRYTTNSNRGHLRAQCQNAQPPSNVSSEKVSLFLFSDITHFYRACFIAMAKKRDLAVVYVDADYKDFITENLMIINQIISVRLSSVRFSGKSSIYYSFIETGRFILSW